MNDEHLPPEGRLTDQQRARLRAGLMASATTKRRPWLVPVAAAACVGLVVAGAAAASVSTRGDGTPAAAQTSAAPTTTPTPAPTASATPTATPTPSPSDEPTGTLPPIGPCVQEVQAQLPDARDVDRVVSGDFATYLFSTGEQWAVCDTWAMRDDGPPTVLAPHRFPPELDKDLFLVSTNLSTDPADGGQFFAGGARIPGVAAISYRFPSGDTVDATITEGMWSMQYLPDRPPRRLWTDPVVVTVRLDDGTTQRFDLTGMDLCAQVNHGC